MNVSASVDAPSFGEKTLLMASLGRKGTWRETHDTLPDSDGQVFVFHFPGVIERVIRGMPNQVPQRPDAGHFALGMERPNGIAIGVAVRSQALVGPIRIVRSV